MAKPFTIVGLGEALFDIFPDRQILGGAPLNVAYHAHQIAARHGGRGVACSRVGRDDLGNKIIAQVAALGMTTDFIQTDVAHKTGTVHVTLDAGKPSYEIVKDVAWDFVTFDDNLASLATNCDAVCFGSLVQRGPQSRDAVHRFLTAATRAVRMFDVNLRQHYFDHAVLHRGFEFATVIKLNDEELPTVASVLGVTTDATGDVDAVADARVRALMKRYPNVRSFALTRGARGTLLFTGSERLAGAPVSYPLAPNADSVGAGDACSAGLLLGFVLGWPAAKTVLLANHLGAYVASQPGATPTLPASVLKFAD